MKPLSLAAFAVAVLSTFGVAQAQDYPNKPVTIVVPYAPGGSSDMTARLIADMAQEKLGVPVVIDNRPGGGGVVGTSQVSKSEADGYTLLFFSASPLVIRPLVAEVDYNPLEDFTFLGRFMINHSPIAVRSDSEFQTLEDLLDFARENPGKLRWGAGAVMGSSHLAIEAMFRTEGVQTTFVPTDGGVEAMTNLIGGQLEFVSVTDFPTPLKEGKVRLLAESGPVAIEGLEGTQDVKTLKDYGYPLVLGVYTGLAAPSGLSDEAVALWDEVLGEVAASERFEELVKGYSGRSFYADSQTFTTEIEAEITDLKTVIQDLGLAN